MPAIMALHASFSVSSGQASGFEANDKCEEASDGTPNCRRELLQDQLQADLNAAPSSQELPTQPNRGAAAAGVNDLKFACCYPFFLRKSFALSQEQRLRL